MSSGLPDFFKVTRISKGKTSKSTGSKVVASLGYTTLIEVEGAGVIFGGGVFLNHTATQANSEVIVKVDGTNMISHSFMFMDLFGLDIVGIFPMVIRKYDDAAFIYGVGICGGIVFEKSFDVIYNELHGETPLVIADLMYVSG